MAEQKIAHLFLQSFVKEIIKNIPVKDENNPELEFYKEEKPLKEKYAVEMSKIEKPLKIINLKGNLSRAQTINLSNMPATPSRYKIRQVQKYALPKMPEIKSSAQQQFSKQLQQTFGPGFSKIQFLIKDPAITEIECRGADQNLLVRKGGTIQLTKVMLTEQEIMELLNYFSAKTRIPIISGTFKAAAENIIMTAVISEIIGPRFIIQKRNPFQKLVPF